MPWNAQTFAKHNHGLSGAEAGKAATIANAVLKRTGDEGLAIRVANARAHGHAMGGGIAPGFDMGGGVNPVQQLITALQSGIGAGAGAPGGPGVGIPGAPNPMQPSSIPMTNATSPTGMPASSTAPQMAGHMGIAPAGVSAMPMRHDGGALKRADGGFNVAKGPNLRPPYFERGAERQLHVGPVLSNVPGRTDNHKVRVPAGSYVLPAQHVASMGHGNSVAGLDLASKMFSGPYGSSVAHVGHGHLPRPPKPMTNYADGGMAYSEGGARGHHDLRPVDVDISGGEFVIPPWAIIARYGSLKHGHAILDQWVMDTRKKEIAIQKKLPPPAKKWMGGAVW